VRCSTDAQHRGAHPALHEQRKRSMKVRGIPGTAAFPQVPSGARSRTVPLPSARALRNRSSLPAGGNRGKGRG